MTTTTRTRTNPSLPAGRDAWATRAGVSWRDLATEVPDLAAVGEALLDRYRMAFLGTVTWTGAPRVHPVCPAILDGRLLLGIRGTTPKYADLRRDPRCVLHALPGEGDQEFFVRCTAVEPTDERVRVLAAAPDGSGVLVDEDDVLYELLVHQACTAQYEVIVEDGQAEYRSQRSSWPSAASKQ